MPSTHRVVLPLRILLAMLFAALLGVQALGLPRLLWGMAEEFPDLAYLRWPLLTFGVLELACVQVVIVCTWTLLTMVADDRIFSGASSGWVDAIVRAIATAWAVLFGGFVYVAVGGQLPGLSAALLVLLIVGAAVGFLVVIMRALLREATTLRTDMEEVI